MQTEQANESANTLREATDNFDAELRQLKVDHEAEVSDVNLNVRSHAIQCLQTL